MSRLLSLGPIAPTDSVRLYEVWGLLSGFFMSSLPLARRDSYGDPVFGFQSIVAGFFGAPLGYSLSMVLHRRFGKNSIVSLMLPTGLLALGHYMLKRFGSSPPPSPPNAHMDED